MKFRFFIYMAVGIGMCSIPALALSMDAPISSGTSVSLAVHVYAPEIAYGDIVAYDQTRDVYILSQQADDPRVYGITAKNPPVTVYTNPSDIPVLRSGRVLVNVTLENGPINPGDSIVASSIPGKGMRAASTSEHSIGIAREAFSSLGTSTTPLSLNGKNIAAGTIIVDLSPNLGNGTSSADKGGTYAGGCTAGYTTCLILSKINATPLVQLVRYILAAAVALGSLYLAFRSFMTDATNGIISIGRNPRARGAIQAMVVFNAFLAGGIALGGLIVGLVILFIPL